MLSWVLLYTVLLIIVTIAIKRRRVGLMRIESELASALKACDLQKIRKLVAAKAKRNQSKFDTLSGETLLHLSVNFLDSNENPSDREKHIQVIDLLLELGCPIDCVNRKGDTPLFTLLWWNNVSAAHELIKRGADLFAPSQMLKGHAVICAVVVKGNLSSLLAILQSHSVDVRKLKSQLENIKPSVRSLFPDGEGLRKVIEMLDCYETRNKLAVSYRKMLKGEKAGWIGALPSYRFSQFVENFALV